MYQDTYGEWISLPPVKYSLNIQKPFIASPGKVFLKTDSESHDQFFLQNEDLGSMYKRKQALIIGIESFYRSGFFTTSIYG